MGSFCILEYYEYYGYRIPWISHMGQCMFSLMPKLCSMLLFSHLLLWSCFVSFFSWIFSFSKHHSCYRYNHIKFLKPILMNIWYIWVSNTHHVDTPTFAQASWLKVSYQLGGTQISKQSMGGKYIFKIAWVTCNMFIPWAIGIINVR